MRSFWIVFPAVLLTPPVAGGQQASALHGAASHERSIIEFATRRAERDPHCAEVMNTVRASGTKSHEPRWTVTCRTPQGGALVLTVSRDQPGPESAPRGSAGNRVPPPARPAAAGGQALANDWAAEIEGWSDSTAAYAVMLALGAAGLFIYLMPGIMATERRHPRKAAIWFVSILLGWTFVGWVGALLWAAAGGSRPRAGTRGAGPATIRLRG